MQKTFKEGRVSTLSSLKIPLSKRPRLRLGTVRDKVKVTRSRAEGLWMLQKE